MAQMQLGELDLADLESASMLLESSRLVSVKNSFLFFLLVDLMPKDHNPIFEMAQRAALLEVQHLISKSMVTE